MIISFKFPILMTKSLNSNNISDGDSYLELLQIDNGNSNDYLAIRHNFIKNEIILLDKLRVWVVESSDKLDENRSALDLNSSVVYESSSGQFLSHELEQLLFQATYRQITFKNATIEEKDYSSLVGKNNISLISIFSVQESQTNSPNSLFPNILNVNMTESYFGTIYDDVLSTPAGIFDCWRLEVSSVHRQTISFHQEQGTTGVIDENKSILYLNDFYWISKDLNINLKYLSEEFQTEIIEADFEYFNSLKTTNPVIESISDTMPSDSLLYIAIGIFDNLLYLFIGGFIIIVSGITVYSFIQYRSYSKITKNKNKLSFIDFVRKRKKNLQKKTIISTQVSDETLQIIEEILEENKKKE